VRSLIRPGVDLHGGAPSEPLNTGEDSVLYSDAAGDDLSRVEWLVSKGVNLSHTTRYGWVPLHCCANGRHHEVVQVLLRAGFNPSPLSDTGITPIDLATGTR